MATTSTINTVVILPGPVPPELREEWNVYGYLSTFMKGTIIQPVWSFCDDNGNQIKTKTIGKFNIHLFYTTWLPRPVKFVFDIVLYTFHGLRAHWKEPVELIITYGTTRTGLAGFILKHLCGAKLIVEVPGIPKDAFLLDKKKPTLTLKIVNGLASSWPRFLLRSADRCKLLYKEQLDGLNLDDKIVFSNFADLVPISQIQKSETSSDYILSVGVPWHLKGMDILIAAFKRIKHKYPNLKLKLYGYCEDRPYFQSLIGDDNSIEMGKGISRNEVIELLSNCLVFVLPSRTEAMGRVLLEAMATKKPIIASNVGGIPSVIEDEKNGLLFETENVDSLVTQLTRVLDDDILANRLAESGFKVVHDKLNEATYIENYKQMVVDTLGCKI